MVVKRCSLRAVIGEANRVGSHEPPIAQFFVNLIAIKVQQWVREFFNTGFRTCAHRSKHVTTVYN